MSALLARINCDSGLPVSEYLHRDETLFVEAEWSWRALQATAFRFATRELAEAAVPSHPWRTKDGQPGVIWVLPCVEPDTTRRREKEEDRIQTALSGSEPETVAPAEKRGVSPAALISADAPTRKRATRQNRAVARTRKIAREAQADAAVTAATTTPQRPSSRGAEKWKEVYHRRVSPSESYAMLEERHLD